MQISHRVPVPKIMKVGWQQAKLFQQKAGLIFTGPACIYFRNQKNQQ